MVWREKRRGGSGRREAVGALAEATQRIGGRRGSRIELLVAGMQTSETERYTMKEFRYKIDVEVWYNEY